MTTQGKQHLPLRRIARRAAGWLALALLTAATAPAAAPRGLGRAEQDRIARMVFAPDLVMRHQTEIGLGGAQKQALVDEMQRTQSDLVPLQVEMSEAAESLRRYLDGPRVDEAAALAEAERVMRLESEIKRRHLTMLIRIKNLLTEEQQTELRLLRRRGAR